MDGYETAAMIRQDLPILFLTAYRTADIVKPTSRAERKEKKI
jgi:CheY-like chemotaxis protein